jgi:hypothetical protein
VSPGAVETDMLERFTGGDERAKAEFKAAHPLGRAASVADIAKCRALACIGCCGVRYWAQPRR